MTAPDLHTFHIPVMGLAFTIDTPLKVARFGISSVVSIVEDDLVEQMRAFHCAQAGEAYVPIPTDDIDHRAKRITAYLNLLSRIVTRQVERLRAGAFGAGADIDTYFALLPSFSSARRLFERMRGLGEGDEKAALQDELRARVVAGAIDVNIMTKCDRTNYDPSGEPLPGEYADARAALRGLRRWAWATDIMIIYRLDADALAARPAPRRRSWSAGCASCRSTRTSRCPRPGSRSRRSRCRPSSRCG